MHERLFLQIKVVSGAATSRDGARLVAPVEPGRTEQSGTVRRVAATNWSGNYVYGARAIHAPATTEQLQEIVATLPRVRVLGSRHSFTDIADSDELVSLRDMSHETVVDRDAMTVSVTGAVRYGELAEDLAREGLALANLASLPHIAVAGAVATATHGSGDRNGNLATAVAWLEFVTSDGSTLRVARGDPDFDGIVVNLGAAGVMTRVALDVEPAYEVRQHVFERLQWETLLERFDEITATGYSVSVFSTWGAHIDQVWVKSRVQEDAPPAPEELFGATAATVDRHVIGGLDPMHCTAQLGARGPWSERLPHFRMGFRPSSGAEIQSEYVVARSDAGAAVEAIRRVAAPFRGLIQVSEIRTIAADTLWMSPQYGQDTVAFHFTWQPDQHAVEAALVKLEDALAPMRARPHWGKLFIAGADRIRSLYERADDFAALLARLDPRGAFRNDWLEARVLGSD
jgi:xylitol oxidase